MTTGNTIHGDDRSIPHRCPICAKEPGTYSGKLVLPGKEAPMCDNHTKALKQGRLTPAQVTMVPVPGAVFNPQSGPRSACIKAGGYVNQAEGWCPGHEVAA